MTTRRKLGESHRPWVHALLLVLAYALLPGLPREAFAGQLGLLPGGWVNLESLILGAVGIFLPRGFLFLLLLLESLADFTYALCSTYQFSLGSLAGAAGSVGALPKERLGEIVGASLLALIVCLTLAALPRRPESIRHAVTGLLTLGVVLLVGAVLGGQSRLRHHDSADTGMHLVRSPLLSLMLRESFLRRVEASSRSRDETEARAASSFLPATASAERAPDVVLILVESWGLANDAGLKELFSNRYRDAAVERRYIVSEGSVPFHGSTVSAEARELCHSQIGFGILHTTAASASPCLPQRLGRNGYTSIAIHGYSGRMFERALWYPTLGFERTWFGADLDQAGLARCPGAFTGICDADVARWIGDAVLKRPETGPRFVYWVTLNSHLPVPVRPDLPPDTVCSAQSALRQSRALCSWARLIGNVHLAVQVLALKVDRPTIFLLVGDHAPPFAEPGLRRQFSTTDVPYLLLQPKDRPEEYAAPRG